MLFEKAASTLPSFLQWSVYNLHHSFRFSNPQTSRILYSILPLNNPPLCAATSMPSPRLPPRLRRRSKVRDVTHSLHSSWRLSHHAHSYHRPDLRLSHFLFSNHRRLLRTGQEGIDPRQTRKSPRTNKDFSCRAPRIPALP